jgi:hypothetical protein
MERTEIMQKLNVKQLILQRQGQLERAKQFLKDHKGYEESVLAPVKKRIKTIEKELSELQDKLYGDFIGNRK